MAKQNSANKNMKKIIVPLSHLRKIIEENMLYPVNLSSISANGGACWVIRNEEQLDEVMSFHANDATIEDSQVSYMRYHNGMYDIDCSKYGRLEMSMAYLSQVQNQETCTYKDTCELHELMSDPVKREMAMTEGLSLNN